MPQTDPGDSFLQAYRWFIAGSVWYILTQIDGGNFVALPPLVVVLGTIGLASIVDPSIKEIVRIIEGTYFERTRRQS